MMPELNLTSGGGERPPSAPPTPKQTPLSTPELSSVQEASPSFHSSRQSSSSNTTPRQHNRRRSTPNNMLERRLSSIDQTPPVLPSPLPAHKIQSSNRPLPTPKLPSQCPLLSVFYAEFDNKVGPKICYQSPENFMEQDIRMKATEMEHLLFGVFEGNSRTEPETVETTKPNEEGDEDPSQFWIFNSCSEYIITGNELTGNIICLSTHHIHILTRPTILSDEKYERNALLFCVGFVLRRTEDPRPFRPALSKLAVILRDMEVESQFLSHTTVNGDRPQIRSLLRGILVSLNSEGCECNLLLGKADALNLKLFRPPKIPAIPVQDHAVPILLRRDWQVQTYDWDLSINWVSLHIDGMANALQISKRAEVDMEMVRACLRVLSHHGVIALVDMFFYTNRYECTEKVASLLSHDEDNKLLLEAVEFVIKRHTNAGPAVSRVSATRNSDPNLELHSTSPMGRTLDPHQNHLLSTSHPTDSSKERHLVGLGPRRGSSASPHSTHEYFTSSMKREDYNEVRTAVAEFFCALSRTTTIGDLWLTLVSNRIPLGTSSDVNWRKMFRLLDHRRLTTFGQIHGLIKRVHNFPLLIDDGDSSTFSAELYQSREDWEHSFSNQDRTRSGGQMREQEVQAVQRQKIASLAGSMMDGMHCDDALVCACQLPLEEIFALFEGKRIASVFSTAEEQRAG